jgi:hypothetical protein
MCGFFHVASRLPEPEVVGVLLHDDIANTISARMISVVVLPDFVLFKVCGNSKCLISRLQPIGNENN